jgi:hypothetical protein
VGPRAGLDTAVAGRKVSLNEEQRMYMLQYIMFYIILRDVFRVKSLKGCSEVVLWRG